MGSLNVILQDFSGSAGAESSFVPRTDLYRQALALHQQNRFDGAEKPYRQILGVEMEHTGATQFLTTTSFTTTDIELPFDVNACFTRGLDCLRANDPSQAEVCFQKIIAIDPHHAGAIHYLGVIASVRKDFVKALPYFEAAISLCDTVPFYYNKDARINKLPKLALCEIRFFGTMPRWTKKYC